jgi:hypothetical protein
MGAPYIYDISHLRIKAINSGMGNIVWSCGTGNKNSHRLDRMTSRKKTS